MGSVARWHRTRFLTPLIIELLVIGVTLGVLISGLVIPVAAGAGAAVKESTTLFDGLPATLSASSLPQTSVMLAADGTPIADFYTENRVQVPLAQITPLLQDAVVAVEDDRFFQHGAVDPKGLLRAVANDVTGGAVEGASTLTQQYVKNVQLEQAVAAHDPIAEQAATARTAARKLQDLRLATSVEAKLTKDQILERYLNIVYFDQQTYGAQAASLRYFGVSASALTLPQAALLGGMVQDPSADDPTLHPAAAQTRRNIVLTDMHRQKMITAAQYTAAVNTPVIVQGSALPNGCDPAGADGFFCEYVVQSILTSPAYSALGATSAQRLTALDSGGLVIHTTLDPKTQNGAVNAVDKAIPSTDPSGLASTAVTVEPGTGAVIAMAEDRAYSVTAGPGQTSVNYATDSSLGGSHGFQTGSSFKPFTLAAWLAAGKGLGDTVDATKRAFPFSDFTACGKHLVGSEPYSPGNSEGTESGLMSVLQATANSVNVAYVAMETQLDLCTIATTAQSLGVHLAVPESVCSTSIAASTSLPTCLPSLTLGVEDIAPLTMAAAYAGFASGGIYCAPQPVSTITRAASSDAPAASVATYAPQCSQALTPAVAAGVNTALTQVLTTGTAAAVGPLSPWASAGKTGTTDGPYDSWFVGYTAQRSTAVWVGDPGTVVNGIYQRRQLTNIDVAGRYYGTIYGASIAAPIWKDLMTTAMQGLPAEPLLLQQVVVQPPPQPTAAAPSPTATAPATTAPPTVAPAPTATTAPPTVAPAPTATTAPQATARPASWAVRRSSKKSVPGGRK
jgi:membrane peptidoglycan carboxypeptidase